MFRRKESVSLKSLEMGYFSYIIHKAYLIIIHLTLCLSVFVDQLQTPNQAVIPCVRLAR